MSAGCCPRHLLDPLAGPCDWGPVTVEVVARFPRRDMADRFVSRYANVGSAYAGMRRTDGTSEVHWSVQTDFEERASESGTTPELERLWTLDCLRENAGYFGSIPHGPKAELRWREPEGEWSEWRCCPVSY